VRNACEVVIKPEGRDHFEDQGADGRTVLKWISKIEDRRLWTSFV
jgi:hypothetical protein